MSGLPDWPELHRRDAPPIVRFPHAGIELLGELADRFVLAAAFDNEPPYLPGEAPDAGEIALLRQRRLAVVVHDAHSIRLRVPSSRGWRAKEIARRAASTRTIPQSRSGA